MTDQASGRTRRSVRRFRHAFIEWIDRHAHDEGRTDAPYGALTVFRISSTTVIRKEPAFGATLGIVAQGSKTLRLHGRTLQIDPSHYLVVTREMQYEATVQPESDLRPFLGVSLTFPPELVAKAMVALADGRVAVQFTDAGVQSRARGCAGGAVLAAPQCGGRPCRAPDLGAVGG